MQDAGRILLLPKGDYAADVTYEMLDLVNHSGASWVCKKDCTGQEPSDSNTAYWQRFGTAVDLSKYLPKSGGTIESADSRPLKIKRTSADTNVAIQFAGASGALGYLGFLNSDEPIYIPSAGSGSKTLLHTGNKPTGTYTGNGDATARRIAIGGIGDVVVLTSVNGSAIVTVGGTTINSPSGGVSRLSTDEVKAVNGYLNLATTNSIVNGNGVEVTYRVL